jgi:glycerophosphoryl diester phosphodiesterase
MGEQQGPQPLLSFWRDGLPAAWRVFSSLLVYGWVWNLFTGVVLFPLGGVLWYALIRLSGDAAQANFQLIAFLFSPLGFGALLVLLTMFLALNFAARAGLYHLLLNALHGRRSTSWRAMGQTLRAGPRLLGVALLEGSLFLLLLVPLAAIGWRVCALLLSDWDINYYFAEKPGEYLLARAIVVAIILAALTAMAFLAVRWAFAVPVSLFEGRHFLGALRGSAALVRGRGWRIFPVLAWEFLRYVFYVFCLAALVLFNEAFLSALGRSNNADVLAAWVTGLMILDLLVFAGVVSLETIVFSLVITLLYENLHRRQGPPPAGRLLDPANASRRLSWRVVLASAGVMLLILGVVGWQTVALARGFTERRPILITAHRAGAKDEPENTLAALQHAIDLHADYAELDVQRTKDGVIVVLHDEDFKRLTGEGKKVWEATYDEIKKLRYKTKKGEVDPKGKFATLEEFIETARGHIKLNIELKYYGDHDDPDLAKHVVRMLESHKFVDQVVITSLDARALKEVRDLNAELRTGIIVVQDVGDIRGYGVAFLSLRQGLVVAGLRQLATSNELEIHAWGAETRADMQEMIRLGVDNLITDDVRLALDVRQRYMALDDVELVRFHFQRWVPIEF